MILLVAAVASVAAGIAPPLSVGLVAVDEFLHPPLPSQPLHTRRSRSASPSYHFFPWKTSSLPAFGVVLGVIVGRGRVSDSSSPLSSAGSVAGVGVVVATGRSDKYAKLEQSRTKILYDKLVFQLFKKLLF